eukprot:CAMPEP_0170398960 /NCGR_PEP_ID=MMETSP0117_2-20130122/23703_1 /TAXON_ID=400756 /ORGANISM="Durinskia baltica, Strain CSIRO CS-38" /LENGTH=216 /DNA_ID=CAMNT_0010655597 /DNA_START=45 /DNA_END=695 /DNA_ORIENTATION=+
MLKFSYAAKAVARVSHRKVTLSVQPSFVFTQKHFFSTEPPKAEETATEEGTVAEEAPPVDPTIALNAEIKELKNQVLRSLAEEENVRRIAKRDVDNAHAYANTSFAKSMLEVADDLERAIATVPAEKRNSDDATLKALVEGIEMTDKNLKKIFLKFGVVKYGKVDDPFDPNFHDALYQIPDASKPNTIGMVVKSGYKLKDRVIRAAQVGARVEPPQ